MTKDSFNKLNEERIKKGEKEFANPRNAAAGSVRQLNSKITMERNLATFMYHIPKPDDYNLKTQYESLEFMKDLTFTVNPNIKKVIDTTKDGTFYVWVKDKAGNVNCADEKGNVQTVVIDTVPPEIMFNYSSLKAIIGEQIGAQIITNEKAKISYSWDNKNWTTTQDYVTTVTATKTPTTEGKYILYAKAKDEKGNESF